MSCYVPQSPKGECGSLLRDINFDSLKDVVKSYLNNRPDRGRYNIWSIPEAVFGNRVDLSSQQFTDILSEKQWEDFKNRGTIDRHQSRKYSKNDLQKIANYLAGHWNRNKFSDFEDLYEYICSILVLSPKNPNGKVKNPNALILFDIALRLSGRFSVWPKKYVYLNGNGPIRAAIDMGLGNFIKERKILHSIIIDYYPELAKLDAAQLEDVLCIYHEQLKQFKYSQL